MTQVPWDAERPVDPEDEEQIRRPLEAGRVPAEVPEADYLEQSLEEPAD
jgi:hypothetical protein